MSYDIQQLQTILEGAILAAGEPLTLERIAALFEPNEAPTSEALLQAIESLKESCEGRGFYLEEVASGYRFQVRENLASWVNRLWEEKPQKYSRAMLETLALIAYRQPLTRGDIEEVRGVAVSSHIIKTLAEREWVKVVGHRDVPGRPALYATTRLFLDYFNLKSLDELPTLGELKDIDSLNTSLEFDSLPPEIQGAINTGKAVGDVEESSSSDTAFNDVASEDEAAQTQMDLGEVVSDEAMSDDDFAADKVTSVSLDEVIDESQEGRSEALAPIDASTSDQERPSGEIQAGGQPPIISEEPGDDEPSKTNEPENQDNKDSIHD